MDDSMQLTPKKNKHRTLLYAGDRHVGTIVQQGKTSFQWLVQKATGHATSYDKAFDAIVEELKKP